jgi:hypothetical protein
MRILLHRFDDPGGNIIVIAPFIWLICIILFLTIVSSFHCEMSPRNSNDHFCYPAFHDQSGRVGALLDAYRTRTFTVIQVWLFLVSPVFYFLGDFVWFFNEVCLINPLSILQRPVLSFILSIYIYCDTSISRAKFPIHRLDKTLS